jgi:DNA polymerase-1
MTGDAADNIKGADKIGPKTAAALLAEFGDLEHLIAGAENIKKPSVRESVIRNTDRLRKNYELIRLDRKLDELPLSLNEMVYRDQGVGTMDVLKSIGVKK